MKRGTPGAPRRKVRRILLELGLVVAVLAAVGFWRSAGHLRGPLPALSLAALDGSRQALPALAGKPTLLAFSAPWCGVCKANAQNVRWAASIAGDRARVVSIVSSYADAPQVRAFAAEHELPAPVLLDDRGAAQAFGVTAFPTFVFVDAAGRVTGSTVGYTTTAGLLARLFF